MRTHPSSWITLSILSLVACSSNNDVRRVGAAESTGGAGGGLGTLPGLVCTPGTTQECVGPGSCHGAQSCNTDGLAWGGCDCGTGTGTGGTGNVGGSTSNTGGYSAAGGSTSACLTGPGPSNACWYQPWANGSCTASLVSASSSDIAAAFTDESSACNAGIGFGGTNNALLNLSAYSYISVSVQAGSGQYFDVQLTDTAGDLCYWEFVGNGATKTYLVDMTTATYCSTYTMAKAQIQNIDFTTSYSYAGDFTLDIYSVTFM